MAKRSPAAQAWLDALRPASRRRGMRFVSGTAFILDDVYITSVEAHVVHPDRDRERLRINWVVDVKPLAVDEILWAAFLPDVVMGPQKRIDHRIAGAFQVRPLRIASGSLDVDVGGAPDWDPVLDEFDRVRNGFITAHPAVADFVAALEQDRGSRASGQELVRTITALIAADRAADAARIADDATARGERGPMSSTVDVLKYLSAYAKGPDAYATFTASLSPTHNLQVHHESQRSTSTDLAREHHPGRIGHHLSSLDGSNPWAVVLAAHPPTGAPDDHSTSLYMQAAGTAEAMVLEFCHPGGAELGAVSVRSVVGRPNTDQDLSEVEIVLPRSTERIGPHEVFTADEAAELFELFYRTDTIADGYTLRPVEGYTPNGSSFDPHDTTI
ncbi:hypothetical protein [Occultella gossypii]|uniref:PH domain-containing protein n=1 Tax=Occultella gossypii TaxID=2800820 RepID=A0ABS7S8D8_9MICO|nr:hypothetical protein [Occultella gossypii]MBZ2196567.1 hypothetical protein [Occultella gossypii]